MAGLVRRKSRELEEGAAHEGRGPADSSSIIRGTSAGPRATTEPNDYLLTPFPLSAIDTVGRSGSDVTSVNESSIVPVVRG